MTAGTSFEVWLSFIRNRCLSPVDVHFPYICAIYTCFKAKSKLSCARNEELNRIGCFLSWLNVKFRLSYIQVVQYACSFACVWLCGFAAYIAAHHRSYFHRLRDKFIESNHLPADFSLAVYLQKSLRYSMVDFIGTPVCLLQ